MRHRKDDRDPTQGRFAGMLDTGKGSKSGELTRDEVDSTAEKTQPLGRFLPQRKMLDEQRGKKP